MKSLSKSNSTKTLTKPKAKRPKKTYPAPVAKPKVKGKSLKKPAKPVGPAKQLHKPVLPPAPPRSGPKPVVPKGYKWKGKKHPMFDGCKMVLPENMPDVFPKLHLLMVPNTLWVIDPTGKRMESLATVMPDGVLHGWDFCANCSNHCTRCICKTGILHPRSIEWIYIMTILRENGDDPYKGGTVDSTGHLVRQHGVMHYKDHKPKTGTQQDAAYFRALRAPRPVQAAPAQPHKGLTKPKKTLKKAQPKGEAVDVSKVDIIALAKEATTGNDALEVSVMKRLAKPGKKTLIKKGKK